MQTATGKLYFIITVYPDTLSRNAGRREKYTRKPDGGFYTVGDVKTLEKEGKTAEGQETGDEESPGGKAQDPEVQQGLRRITL